MKIFIHTPGEMFSVIVNETDTVHELIQKLPHDNHHHHWGGLRISFDGEIMRNPMDKLSDYGIKDGDCLNCSINSIGGGFIDNLKEESKSEIAKKIGFDMNLIQREELNINLIHFDANMTNEENYEYFNNFKVNVVGGFHAMDDINIFKKLLVKISEKNIPFLVVSSGSSGKDIIPICKQYSFIKEVIIFCMNYEYNKHYIEEYPGYVKKVLTSISDLYDYLKAHYGRKVCCHCNQNEPYQFLEYQIFMENQIQECPVITAEEYDKCYFLIHRAFAYFFGDFKSKNHSFNEDNYKIIEKLINNLDNKQYFKDSYNKNDLMKIFKKLKNINESDAFVEQSIRAYTGESIFCYLFNRMMRNIESGIVFLAYYMGPLLFELNKYVKNHSDFAFSKDMTLYRKFNCSETEFYLYKLNLNHIICFPSLTSTSSEDIDFTPTGLASSINKTGYDSFSVKLIIKYRHESDNISPGIIIEDKKGTYGDNLSYYGTEKEVLLFPFTFAKILSIDSEYGNKIVRLEIVNRKSYLEYDLRNNVENRQKFSSI